MARKRKWTARRRGIFLDVLRKTANVSAAARAVQMNRRAAYALRNSDGEFRAEWESALEEALDELEAELRRRAIHGVEKPVFYAGERCGSFTNYSDSLGMFLLRAHRRHVYGDKAVPDSEALQADNNAPSARERLLSRLKALVEDGEAGADGADTDSQP